MMVINCYLFQSSVFGTVPPVLAATGTQANTTVSNPAIAFPTGIAAGHFLFAQVVFRGTLSVGFSIDTPTGWTLISQSRHTGGAGELQLGWFYKYASGSESGSQTFTCTGTFSGRSGGVIQRITGVLSSGTPYEGFASFSGNGASGSGDGSHRVKGSAVTTTRNGDLIISTQVTESGIAGFTADAAWVDVFDAQIAGAGPDYVWQCTSKDVTTPQTVAACENTPTADVEYLSFTMAVLSPD